MENKPKMILEMDEYNKLLSGSTMDSKMAHCLLMFLGMCELYKSRTHYC